MRLTIFALLAAAVLSGCTNSSSGTCAACGITEEQCAAQAEAAGCESFAFLADANAGGTCLGGTPGPGCSFENCASELSCPTDAAVIPCLCGPYATIDSVVEGVDLSVSPAAIARPGINGATDVTVFLAGDAPECLADGRIGPDLEVKRLIISVPSGDGPASISLVGDTPTTEIQVFAEEAEVTLDVSDASCVNGAFTATFIFFETTGGTTNERTYNVTGSFSAEKDGR